MKIYEFVAYREHVMTFLICFLSFLLKYIKLSEEIEGYDCVDVDNDGQQENGQHELLAVVGNSF